MVAKLERTTKHRIITKSHNGSNNQQQINTSRTITLERTAAKATGRGLNCIFWYHIFVQDSAGVEAQNMLSLHGRFLTIAMSHHRRQFNLINALWWNRKMAHNSQIVKAKENLKLSDGGPSYSQASGTNRPIKALRQFDIDWQDFPMHWVMWLS